MTPRRAAPRTFRRILAAATCLAAAIPSLPACAGQFSVTPVRIYMGPRDRATAITITNEGSEELVMQADIFSWQQKPSGEDDLALTEDLFLAPPIIKLAPNSRQVVRLALLKPSGSPDQLTYRMILREVAEARASQTPEVTIALAFSLPVFITPPTAKSKLDCQARRAAADLVRVDCENTGNAYANPREFVVTGAAGEKLASRDNGGYILPGIKRSFDVKRPEGALPAGPVKVAITLDDGSTRTLDVRPAE